MPTTKPAKMSAEELQKVRERAEAKPPSAFAEDEFELVLREGARLRALIADVPALLAHIAALEEEAAELWEREHHISPKPSDCPCRWVDQGEFCPTNPYRSP